MSCINQPLLLTNWLIINDLLVGKSFGYVHITDAISAGIVYRY